MVSRRRRGLELRGRCFLRVTRSGRRIGQYTTSDPFTMDQGTKRMPQSQKRPQKIEYESRMPLALSLSTGHRDPFSFKSFVAFFVLSLLISLLLPRALDSTPPPISFPISSQTSGIGRRLARKIPTSERLRVPKSLSFVTNNPNFPSFSRLSPLAGRIPVPTSRRGTNFILFP